MVLVFVFYSLAKIANKIDNMTFEVPFTSRGFEKTQNNRCL
jgi:hypothetical protein